MRLSEDQVKQGILHPEQFVRDIAAQYFAGSFSDDPTVMPLVVEAIKTYGWLDAFEFFSSFADLAQIEETLLWFIDELDRAGRQRNPHEANNCLRLSAVVSMADVGLVMGHEAEITRLAGFSSKYRRSLAERIRLFSTDTETCWVELERFCEKEKSERYIDRVDLGHATRLVEAIGRDDSRAHADRVLSILSRKIENYENNAMGWMEPLAVRLAGEMRLEKALPLLVAKLHKDGGDLLNEECVRAFAKIGTDAAVGAIRESFPTAPWHYKLYASSALEMIRSDTVAPVCLELHEHEEDGSVSVHLLRAALNAFSSQAVAPVRDLTLAGIYELRWRLVAVVTLMGIGLPELDEWMAEEKQAADIGKRGYLEMVTGVFPPRAKPKSRSYADPFAPKPQLTITGRESTGRNAPCPCGSGKKYKKCCLGKSEGS